MVHLRVGLFAAFMAVALVLHGWAGEVGPPKAGERLEDFARRSHARQQNAQLLSRYHSAMGKRLFQVVDFGELDVRRQFLIDLRVVRRPWRCGHRTIVAHQEPDEDYVRIQFWHVPLDELQIIMGSRAGPAHVDDLDILPTVFVPQNGLGDFRVSLAVFNSPSKRIRITHRYDAKHARMRGGNLVVLS